MKLTIILNILLVSGISLGNLLPGVVPGSELEAGLSSPLEQRDCTANSCLRGVTGDNAKPAEVVRRADCSSFLRQTVILPTTTVVRNQRRGQDIVQNSIPLYAITACDVASRYSSACSCWGFVATTVTIQPSTIVTIQFTSTKTSSARSVTSSSSSTKTLVQSTSSVLVKSTTSSSSTLSTTSSQSSSATLSSSSSISKTLDQSSTSSSAQPSISPSFTTLHGILQINATGTSLGYLAPDPNYWTPLIVSDVTRALVVSFNVPVGATAATSVEFSAPNLQGGHPFLGFVVGRDSTSSNLASGSFNYLYLDPTDHTPPGSTPQSVPSYFSISTGLDKQSESSVWSIDLATGIVTPSWINTDGSAPNTQIFVQSNHIYGSGDPSAFQSRFPAPVTSAILVFISQ